MVVHGPGTLGSDLGSGPSVLIRISAETGSGDTGGGWPYLSVTVTVPSFPVVQNIHILLLCTLQEKKKTGCHLINYKSRRFAQDRFLLNIPLVYFFSVCPNHPYMSIFILIYYYIPPEQADYRPNCTVIPKHGIRPKTITNTCTYDVHFRI